MTAVVVIVKTSRVSIDFNFVKIVLNHSLGLAVCWTVSAVKKMNLES